MVTIGDRGSGACRGCVLGGGIEVGGDRGGRGRGRDSLCGRRGRIHLAGIVSKGGCSEMMA